MSLTDQWHEGFEIGCEQRDSGFDYFGFVFFYERDLICCLFYILRMRNQVLTSREY